MDYGTYTLSRRELIRCILTYLGLDAVIAYLFYRSLIAFVLFAPGVILFLRIQKKELARQRSREMLRQFMTGMQLVSASLQAGYAVENAFREALTELRKIYDPDAFIIVEFRWILSQVALNIPIESLLLDLGRRSHIDDIRNFAEVFQTAKRTGGDLMAIIRNTVACIQTKTETREEIETNISGKVMEQNIMSLVPVLILGYVTLTSPGFLDVCYHNLTGVAVMTVCLLVYLAAFLWGRRIMDIPV